MIGQYVQARYDLLDMLAMNRMASVELEGLVTEAAKAEAAYGCKLDAYYDARRAGVDYAALKKTADRASVKSDKAQSAVAKCRSSIARLQAQLSMNAMPDSIFGHGDYYNPLAQD